MHTCMHPFLLFSEGFYLLCNLLERTSAKITIYVCTIMNYEFHSLPTFKKTKTNKVHSNIGSTFVLNNE